MTRTEAQIGFEHLGIGSVLKRHQLRVPPHQREYAWRTDEEVTRLFQDFARAISKSERAYFLGTIVTIPRGPSQLEVIDGQQRLATCAILLHAIQSYLRDSEPTIADSITPFLSDYSEDRRSKVPRLALNVEDNEHFRRLMEGEETKPTRPSHHLLEATFHDAAQYIRNIVRPHDKNTHGDILNQWLTFVEHYAQVVLLKVPDSSNAFKMFETLNDRGLRTSQSDLIKNYLFGESGSRLPETQQKWESMRAILSGLDSEEDMSLPFIRHAMIAIRGHLTEKEVYETTQTLAKGENQSVQFATDLEQMASDYVAMFNPEHEKWNTYQHSVRRAIETLNLLHIKPMHALMLAIAVRFDPSEAADAYNQLISWGVRLLIAGSTRSGSVEETLAKWANDVYTGSVEAAARLRAQATKVVPNDSQFREGFRLARSSKASLARYYLRSMEQAAKEVPDPFYRVNDDQQIINLEHVMPIRPEENWPHVDAELIRTYCRRLGNLTLLQARDNSDMRSASFREKRVVYENTPYLITQMIAVESEWGPNEIDERQKRLAEWAIKAWPL